MTRARDWVRLPGRDRIWLGLHTAGLSSTTEPTGRDAVRARLREIAAADPGCVLFRQAHPRRPDLWRAARDVEEALARADALPVELLPGRDRASVTRALEEFVARGSTGPQVTIFVHETTDGGPGVVGYAIPHVWGDALTALGVGRSLVTGPDPGGRLWTHVGTPVRRPLAAALRLRFGRPSALRSVPAARRAGTSGPAPAAEAAPSPASTASSSPAEPVVLAGSITGTPLRDLKAWRREHGGGASLNAVVMAVTRAALLAEGVALSGDLVVVYDDRIFLAPGSSTRGNFVSALRLRPADPCDPASVHDAVQAAMSAGRPLLALAAGATLSAAVRRPQWPAAPAAGGTPDLSFACVRSDRVLPPHLVRGADGENVLVCVTTPATHASVAAMVIDQGSEIHVTLTAHAPLVERDAVRRALGRLAADPVSLLPVPATAVPAAPAATSPTAPATPAVAVAP